MWPVRRQLAFLSFPFLYYFRLCSDLFLIVLETAHIEVSMRINNIKCRDEKLNDQTNRTDFHMLISDIIFPFSFCYSLFLLKHGFILPIPIGLICRAHLYRILLCNSRLCNIRSTEEEIVSVFRFKPTTEHKPCEEIYQTATAKAAIANEPLIFIILCWIINIIFNHINLSRK